MLDNGYLFDVLVREAGRRIGDLKLHLHEVVVTCQLVVGGRDRRRPEGLRSARKKAEGFEPVLED